jgi:hypothetical protein
MYRIIFVGFIFKWEKMDAQSIVFTREMVSEFKKWINDSEINDEDFNRLFLTKQNLQSLFGNFDEYIHCLGRGPLKSWLIWLKNALALYIYIHWENVGLDDLSSISNVKIKTLTFELQNYFKSKYSHLGPELNSKLVLAVNRKWQRNITFKELTENIKNDQNSLKFNKSIHFSDDSEIFSSGNIKVYKDWEKLNKKLIAKNEFSFKNNFTHLFWDWNFGLIHKLFILFIQMMIVFFVLLGLIKMFEKIYIFGNKIVSDKIKLYEPVYQWSEKNIGLKENQSSEILKVSYKEELDKIQKFYQMEESLRPEDRFEEESEVEEGQQGNVQDLAREMNRDNPDGKSKIFRILIKSTNSIETKMKMEEILKIFHVQNVSESVVSSQVPGGYYYNGYVPLDRYKDFFQSLGSFEGHTLFVSKTNKKPPDGHFRVFIWIKSI